MAELWVMGSVCVCVHAPPYAQHWQCLKKRILYTRTYIFTYIYIFTHRYIHMYIYLYIYVCVLYVCDVNALCQYKGMEGNYFLYMFRLLYITPPIDLMLVLLLHSSFQGQSYQRTDIHRYQTFIWILEIRKSKKSSYFWKSSPVPVQVRYSTPVLVF